MPALSDVAREKLQALEANNRKRTLVATSHEMGVTVEQGGKKLISFSCNDYLGLTHHAAVKSAAIEAINHHGTGAGASRLVTGNHPLYTELETKLARYKGT